MTNTKVVGLHSPYIPIFWFCTVQCPNPNHKYNSGYHGHFRSKSRTDFYCEYRTLAKPPPPKVFNKRMTNTAATHMFSKHDNRHSFMDDALYFEQGMGRKRIKSRCSSRFNPDLLTWMPLKRETDAAPPKKSVYKRDFRNAMTAIPPEMLVQPPMTSFDDQQPVTTSYRYAHGTDHPNKALLSVMSNRVLSSGSATNRIARPPKQKETVGSCMNWITAECKPRVPDATPMYVPHPPPPTAAPSKPLRNNFMSDTDAATSSEPKEGNSSAIAAL
ncbi:hypothetical protein CAPTEDRAFT_196725 [Capitella teleta]|uniref:Domain of unknown function with conserved HDNR motif domain-containing protein n=1 Tax=Capitella teleta TaxID=283909 RepID=R7U8U6_CAPTE|nr:hypothetical protein CAPTEDRAFT_196725 [Capitella teleta]|eukprot:ELU02546.1 hypothetical protein CAPTEDRAFT_196725 [Capitella teleta]